MPNLWGRRTYLKGIGTTVRHLGAVRSYRQEAFVQEAGHNHAYMGGVERDQRIESRTEGR